MRGTLEASSLLFPITNDIPDWRAACWPIGCIFTSIVDTDPAILLGFGTWTPLASGRVLIGKDAGQTEFDTLEETGGEKAHTLTAAEMPAHTHVQDAHAHGITDPTHNHTQNSHTHPSIQVQGGTTASNAGTHIMTSTATGGSSRAATAPESANAATAVNQAASTGITINNTTATNQNTGGGGAHNNPRWSRL